MARPRMSDAEREAKRRAKSAFTFSDAAYRHYDPKTEGYGSTEQWEAMADAFAEALGLGAAAKVSPQAKTGRSNPDLVTLNLTEMPATVALLKTAYRNTMFVAHPDYGGSNDAARAVIEAFKRLLKHYQ